MNVTDSTSATAFETARPEVLKITPLPEHFINRDISLLDFTARVLEEAFDTSLNPIRAKVSLGMRVLSIMDLGFDHKGGSLFMSYLRNKEQLVSRSQAGALSALGITGIR